jgi:hypothetical protein
LRLAAWLAASQHFTVFLFPTVTKHYKPLLNVAALERAVRSSEDA